ncbi:hypothetical protein QBC36DRAFT_335362 [Triangularia setosa]|uniref:Uncharacterized protein n=1 Tax=Triangularia setosa TaxID=2587417 RepID=A0AAN6W1C6_9PEZI|nr:hypothetical protein QBC36DRAFT_335362 [Podospora setosa]
MARLKENDKHVRQYPLDIPGATPFERYHHPPLTDWDLIVADILQDFMNPSPATASLYGTPMSSFIPWDNALRRLHQIDPRRFNAIASLHESIWNLSPLPSRTSSGARTSLGDIILSVVERFYLENDCNSFQAFYGASYFGRIITSGHPPPVPDTQKTRAKFLGGQTFVGWDRKPEGPARAEGMRKLNQQTKEQLLGLYNGLPDLDPFTRHYHRPHGLHPRARPIYDMEAGFIYSRVVRRVMKGRGFEDREFVQFPLLFRDGNGNIKLATDAERWRGRGAHRIPRQGERGRRCFSEPPPGSWSSIMFSGLNLGWEIPIPAMRLSQLDRKTRRRSLSRGRIQEMFDWDLDIRQRPGKSRKSTTSESRGGVRRLACENCGDNEHTISGCTMPCGHCGSWSPGEHGYFHRLEVEEGIIDEGVIPDELEESHFAPDCPTAKNNRCRCMAFPVYHTAKRCVIRCRPGCGHPQKYKGNAMTCTYRCCMCGIRKSHAGRNCRLKTCRCGGHHLGQDHSWNPTCGAPGCDRYLCGVHCQRCFGTERPFEEETRECWKCQGLDKRPTVWGEEASKKRRRWEKKVEEVRQPFASGSNGTEGGPKAKQKGQDGARDGPGNVRNGIEEGKTGTQKGYQSIFEGGSVQGDVCSCLAPVKAETCVSVVARPLKVEE